MCVSCALVVRVRCVSCCVHPAFWSRTPLCSSPSCVIGLCISFFHAQHPTPFPLPTNLAARSLSFFSSSGFLPLSWPAVLSLFMLRAALAAVSFLLAAHNAARHARPTAKPRSLVARIPTTDGRTTRHAVRRHGWLDHCTTGEYGAYAHRRGGPLSLRPLSPSPYNAAVPKGPDL